MPTLLDFPTELLLEIVGYLKPRDSNGPIVGIDAGWRTLDNYRDSLKVYKAEDQIPEEQGSGEKKSDSKISIYASLTALRS